MITNTCFRVRYLIPVIASVLVAFSSSAELNEVQVYGIAQFGGKNQCGSSGQTHSVHTSTAEAFALAFAARQAAGLWNQVNKRNNTSARGTLWTDVAKNANGNDLAANAGVDEADVIYVHTHGGHSTSPARSTLLMGNKSDACNVGTDTEMRFGNSPGDLEIAVIKACQSGDYDTWLNGGYRQQLTTSSSTFTVWNAFHGDSSCGSHVTSYVANYAASSFSDGVGENWLDEAYDGAFWWWEDDDCPVSIVMGSSRSKRDTMYEYGGFSDRKNTGNKTGSTIYYIHGCQPDSGRALPD